MTRAGPPGAVQAGLLLPVVPFAQAAPAGLATFSLGALLLTFLKIGATLYGSCYVLLAFLRDDVVGRLGWLSDQQILDAVAVAQFTPGPVCTTATFIGYLVSSWPGAIVATVGIFLPSFGFVALVFPFVSRLRASPWTSAFLDGANAAAVGLMAAVAWQLGTSSIIDPLTAGHHRRGPVDPPSGELGLACAWRWRGRAGGFCRAHLISHALVPPTPRSRRLLTHPSGEAPGATRLSPTTLAAKKGCITRWPPGQGLDRPARLALDGGVRLARPLREGARVRLSAAVAEHPQHEATQRSARTAIAVARHLLVRRDAPRLQQLPELGGWLQRPAFRIEQLGPLQVGSPWDVPMAWLRR